MNPALSIAGKMAKTYGRVADTARALHVRCDDGVVLAAQLWRGGRAHSVVVIKPATGVLVRYYHRYAHGSLRSHAYCWRAICGLARFWQSGARWLENGRRCWDIGIIRPVTGHSLPKGNTHASWS